MSKLLESLNFCVTEYNGLIFICKLSFMKEINNVSSRQYKMEITANFTPDKTAVLLLQMVAR